MSAWCWAAGAAPVPGDDQIAASQQQCIGVVPTRIHEDVDAFVRHIKHLR